MPSTVRLAELLASLSLATDLAIGAPLETAIRTCLIATHLGGRLGLDSTTRRDVFYASLLRHVGCTAWAHEAAAIVGGDDHDVIRTFEGVDRARKTAVIGRAFGLGRASSRGKRARAIAGALSHPDAGRQLAIAQCTQAEALAGDLGLPPGVLATLAQMYERHDGRGVPRRLAGDAIAITARLLVAAQLIEAWHRRAGRDGTLAELRQRRGRELAPAIADLAVAEAAALWRILEAPALEAVLAAEPAPCLEIADERLDEIALGFGRFADLKTPHTIGHAPRVAELACEAARLVGCAPAEIAQLRRAALLHDLGVVAIPNGVWEHPGPLGAAAWEQVRLHAYQTERVLARAPALAALAPITGAHHERLDGTGYHRGLHGEDVTPLVRLLAAADSYAALRADRPHREALAVDAALALLEADAHRLGREALAAVLVAAGHDRARPALPANLTAREAQVLGLVARGLTSKEIAVALAIAPRTVKHHIEHVYAKTGVSTRAAAALFAARHDLVG